MRATRLSTPALFRSTVETPSVAPASAAGGAKTCGAMPTESSRANR